MPFHTHKITDNAEPTPTEYEFEVLQGRVDPRAENLEVIVRLGQKDVTLRKTGVRAKTVRLRSIHYVADFEAAEDALAAYKATMDGNLREVIQHSRSKGHFFVIGVEEVEAIPCLNAIGTLVSNPTVRQIVDWTLQQVETPVE